MTPPHDWIEPEWQAAPEVRCFITTRQGGYSTGTYASMNLGTRVNDDPVTVERNRALLTSLLPSPPRWLRQVHGTDVVNAALCADEAQADACFTRARGVVCAIMVADCLPVLICDDAASVVAAAHAGWRGLSAGVIERTVEALKTDPDKLRAYLGPAIGPSAFEVGDEVLEAFVRHSPDAQQAFEARAAGKWLCDLFALARQRLHALGIARITGGTDCTYSDPQRFFSHRRDRISGRMAALIWLEGSPK